MEEEEEEKEVRRKVKQKDNVSPVTLLPCRKCEEGRLKKKLDFSLHLKLAAGGQLTMQRQLTTAVAAAAAATAAAAAAAAAAATCLLRATLIWRSQAGELYWYVKRGGGEGGREGGIVLHTNTHTERGRRRQ